MAQIIFAFTFNTDTREAAFSGNIEIQPALGILQQIAIAEAVKKAAAAGPRRPEETSKPEGQASRPKPEPAASQPEPDLPAA